MVSITEEQIDQAISELKTSSELNHMHGNKEDGCCDLCGFSKQLDERGNAKGEPTALDHLAISSVTSGNPVGLAFLAMPGGVDIVLMLARVCFLAGYKVGKGSDTVAELERMVGL